MTNEEGYVYTSFLVHLMSRDVLEACRSGCRVYVSVAGNVFSGTVRLSNCGTYYSLVDQDGILRTFCNFFIQLPDPFTAVQGPDGRWK